MLNQITIMGRLTRNPELRRTGSGLAVASFSVACERDFPNKATGEKEVDFINCVAWRQTGEFVSKYFTKGSMIVVSGRLQMRKWVDDSGNNRVTAEVVADNVYFGGSKKESSDAVQATSTAVASTATYGGYCGYVTPASDWDMLDDDNATLPF